ncbi:hypothetical protein HDU86_005324, partial [Geranomyces michiganensis]
MASLGTPTPSLITLDYVSRTDDNALCISSLLEFAAVRLPERDFYKKTLNDWLALLRETILRAGRPPMK